MSDRGVLRLGVIEIASERFSSASARDFVTSMTEERALRALTGVKPSGVPHIGNYLGAIRPALELAKKHDSFLFIADFHALTTQHDRKAMEEETYAVAATWLALGLDPKKTVFYKQSDVPQTATLAWILSCFTPMGLLGRAHSYKDAKAKMKDEELNHGVFYYPVLMAADILLYDADIVPVGKDQKQHLEITQEIARKFNNTYGEVLRIPKPQIQEEVMTIPGLDGRKMSKSYGNTIEIFLDEKPLRKRMDDIVTDSTPFGDPLPTDNMMCDLHKLLASKEKHEALLQMFRTGRIDASRPDSDFEQPRKENYFGWGRAKDALAEVINEEIKGPREEYKRLMADKPYIRKLLAEGAERACAVADEVLGRVTDAVGFVR